MKKGELNKNIPKGDKTVKELHEAIRLVSDAKDEVNAVLAESFELVSEENKKLATEKEIINEVRLLKADIEIVHADLVNLDESLKEPKFSRESYALCEDLKDRINKIRATLGTLKSDIHKVEEATKTEEQVEEAEEMEIAKLDKLIDTLKNLEEKFVAAIEAKLPE